MRVDLHMGHWKLGVCIYPLLSATLCKSISISFLFMSFCSPSPRHLQISLCAPTVSLLQSVWSISLILSLLQFNQCFLLFLGWGSKSWIWAKLSDLAPSFLQPDLAATLLPMLSLGQPWLSCPKDALMMFLLFGNFFVTLPTLLLFI